MKRRRWSPSEYRSASASWQNPARCGYCRKRTYPSRRDARRALRALYPNAVGDMHPYRCDHGGSGWHLGSRHVWPSWTDNTTGNPIDCDRCPTVIHIGAPVAHLHGHHLCLDCGDQAEHAAIARDHQHEQQEEQSA